MTEPDNKPRQAGPNQPRQAGPNALRQAAPVEPRKAGPVQVAKAVFWSFLGIRKRAAHEEDAVTITPFQVIVAGIIGAVIFVLSLVVLVRYITS